MKLVFKFQRKVHKAYKPEENHYINIKNKTNNKNIYFNQILKDKKTIQYISQNIIWIKSF